MSSIAHAAGIVAIGVAALAAIGVAVHMLAELLGGNFHDDDEERRP